VVGVDASDGDVALYVVCDLVALDECVAALYNKYALSVIFVYFVVIEGGGGEFLYFYACLAVEADHVVVGDVGLVVLSLYEYAVEGVGCDADVFADVGLAQIFFV
jgi:hypothetical protein